MNCGYLVQLLRKNITNNKKLIHDYHLYRDDYLDEKQELEKLLFITTLNVSTMSFEKIKNIVLGFSISDEEKQDMIEELNVIMTILKLNSINGTNILLDDVQNEVLDRFLNYLHEYILVRKDYNTNNDIDIEELTNVNEKYKSLSTKLNNPKNTKFITDLDTLNTLFNDNKLEENVKRDLLVSLIKYNKNIFNYKIGFTNNMEIARYGNIDIGEVKGIFKKYGYDFDRLDTGFQNKILEFGVIGKIKEVLCVLYQLNIKIDEKENGYFLMSLVLAGDKESIARTMKFILSKNVLVEKLFKIPSVFISEDNTEFNREKTNRFKIVDYSIFSEDKPYIVGTAERFRNNTLLLERYGLSLKSILDKYPQVLIVDSERLYNNLEMFLEYGFSFTKNKRLIDSSLSALTSIRFCDIVDQFIEVHPYGIKYLRDNLSCIKTISSAFDVIFYSIYYSNVLEGEDRAFRRIISNNREYLCLQGDINNRFGEAYMGLTDTNKVSVTNTFIPKFKDQDKYKNILEKNKYRVIDVDIFDNRYIQKINTFSDDQEPLIYNFDGIRISKIKVLRIFNILIKNGIMSNLDSFMFSVSYNTIISENNYNKLYDLIKDAIK